MSERLIIDQTKTNEFIKIENELVPVYKKAFADPPWNERSKCVDDSCTMQYLSACPGELCTECNSLLEDAYSADELIKGWKSVLNDDGIIIVRLNNDLPQCVTIARPTNPIELYERKYSNVPEMEQWVDKNFNDKMVWIEDTFANRERQSSGNLDDRGQVLAAIALRYSGMKIATRTLVPAVISATGRDVGAYTDMYVGSKVINGPRRDAYRNVKTVPDQRTLLVVDGQELL